MGLFLFNDSKKNKPADSSFLTKQQTNKHTPEDSRIGRPPASAAHTHNKTPKVIESAEVLCDESVWKHHFRTSIY